MVVMIKGRHTWEPWGKSALLLNLIESLHGEANMPLKSKPHHNEMFHFYSHKQDDVCGRPRDVTPIEIYSRLYLFGYLREYAPQYKIKTFGKSHIECVVEIYDTLGSVANDLLLTCCEISQNQSVTDLEIFIPTHLEQFLLMNLL